jgi:phosphonate transport system permease protein
MATEDAPPAGEPRTWERPTAFYNRTVKWLVYGGITLFVLWSLWDVRIAPDRFAQGLGAGVEFVVRALPPDFGARQRDLILTGMFESLAMSVVATIVGIIISLPVALMAAENLVPRSVYVVGRSIITVTRAFHELIVAIIAVKAVGFGALAGVIALSYKTIGFFGKLLAEDLEDIDEGQIDAMRATGANRWQVLLYGVLPQVVPRIVGLSIYRWDINIRHSTVIGIVGAGGIGITLLNSFDKYEYDFSFAIIIVIVAVVLFGEGVSALVRRRVQ